MAGNRTDSGWKSFSSSCLAFSKFSSPSFNFLFLTQGQFMYSPPVIKLTFQIHTLCWNRQHSFKCLLPSEQDGDLSQDGAPEDPAGGRAPCCTVGPWMRGRSVAEPCPQPAPRTSAWSCDHLPQHGAQHPAALRPRLAPVSLCGPGCGSL